MIMMRSCHPGSRCPKQIFSVLCVIAGLNVFGAGALFAYDDSRGTPTTATIDHCVPHVVEGLGRGPAHQEVDLQECDGSWRVGGVAQTALSTESFAAIIGRIAGGCPCARRHRVSVGNVCSPEHLVMVGGLVAIAIGVVLNWSMRRKIKTG
jgi:hypothetical protein